MTARLTGRNCDDLRPLLKRFPVKVAADDDATPGTETHDADFVICSGGDGSLLGAERQFPLLPKLAIRDRRNNPKCPLHGDEQVLEAFFSGQLKPQMIAHLQAARNGKVLLDGINDIVVMRQVQSGAIRCRLRENGALRRPQVISDGIVFCTAFGSTGYFQSITRGNFRCGLGIAYSNPMDGDSFAVLGEEAVVALELLRGPAFVVADNNPEMLTMRDGESLELRIAQQRTAVFGIEAFRCPECHRLRFKDTEN
mgnify:CR=1 FL=1